MTARITKLLLLFSGVLLSLSLAAQYPSNPIKSRLGWQTTGDGLVYRGAGAPAYSPGTLFNAWMYLDTTNYTLYMYRNFQWTKLPLVNNGLTLDGSYVQLGGTLVENTQVEKSTYTLDFGKISGSNNGYLSFYGTDPYYIGALTTKDGTESGLTIGNKIWGFEVDDSDHVSTLTGSRFGFDATYLGTLGVSQFKMDSTNFFIRGLPSFASHTAADAGTDTYQMYTLDNSRRIYVNQGTATSDILGTGTATRIPIWTSTNVLGDSPILYNSTTKRTTWDSPGIIELPMGADAQRPSPANTSDFWYGQTGPEWYQGSRWAKAVEGAISKGTASSRVPYFNSNLQLDDATSYIENVVGTGVRLSASILGQTGMNIHMGYGRALSWGSTGTSYNASNAIIGLSGDILSIATNEFKTGGKFSILQSGLSETNPYNFQLVYTSADINASGFSVVNKSVNGGVGFRLTGATTTEFSLISHWNTGSGQGEVVRKGSFVLENNQKGLHLVANSDTSRLLFHVGANSRNLNSGVRGIWTKDSLYIKNKISTASDVVVGGTGILRAFNSAQVNGKFKVGSDSSFLHDPVQDSTKIGGKIQFGKPSTVKITAQPFFPFTFRNPAASSTYVTIESGEIPSVGGEAGLNLVPTGAFSASIYYTNDLYFQSFTNSRRNFRIGIDGTNARTKRTIVAGLVDGTATSYYDGTLIVSDTITAGKALLVARKNNTSSTPIAVLASQNNDRFTFDDDGTTRFHTYGTGTKEAADLSKTESVYSAWYATDGTMIEKRANTEQYFTITSTSSPQTLSNTISDNLINQGGTQASFTFLFPASPADGQVCYITFNNAISTLTIDGNGETIVGSAVTTGVAGSQRKFKFYSGIGWIKQY